MRIIEQKIVKTMLDLRFKDGDRKLSERDYVWTLDGDVYYKLHNTNVICWRGNGDFIVWTGGWRTPTTKSRINNVLQSLGVKAALYQVDFVWYWNEGIEFDDGDVLYFDGQRWQIRDPRISE